MSDPRDVAGGVVPIVPCPACRTLNRVPRDRLADRPVCATCRTALLVTPVPLDTASFERVITRTTLPIVVDFWAPWCGPCLSMAPWFADAAQQLAGTAVFAKVDTEAEPALGARFDVRSIPTLVLFRDGKEQRRSSGAMPAARIVQWVRGG